MNYREKIRKAIECLQLGNETYGEWGILNLTQRKYIKRLLDELDNADNFVKKLYFENKQLKENYERIYNENCKLREEHNITDISLLDENYKLKDNWNKLKKYINEANEDLYWTNNYDDILYVMQELEGSDSNEI